MYGLSAFFYLNYASLNHRFWMILLCRYKPPSLVHSHISIYEQALFKIATVGAPEIKPELGYSANLKDFASQCLSRDPKLRPSAAELLEVILRCVYSLSSPHRPFPSFCPSISILLSNQWKSSRTEERRVRSWRDFQMKRRHTRCLVTCEN